METTNKYHMSFEEAQEYIFKRGFGIPWNDGDVFIDEREIMRTVGNVLKWADDTMVEKGVVWLFENVCYYPEQGYIVKAYEDEMKVKL